MARRIREFNWAQHPFGPPETWPQSMRSAVGICLRSAFPTAIYWGSELRLIYNDAWSHIPGPRHPAALGQPAQEVWSDIWHIIEPQFAQVIETGEGLSLSDQLLPMERFGYPEETYWSYSFTPIHEEDGGIAGVYNSGMETTRDVLIQRQMQFVLHLEEQLATLSEPVEIRQHMMQMLQNMLAPVEIGLCLFDGKGRGEVLAAEPGVEYAMPDELWAWAHREFLDGRALVLHDVTSESDFASFDMPDRFRTGGFLAVPLVRGGILQAVLFAHSPTTCHWNAFDEAALEKCLEASDKFVELAMALEREETIKREVDHRAKNLLAIVRSVVRQTSAKDVPTFRAQVNDRLTALARVHSMLAASNWTEIELMDLISQELAPYGADKAKRICVKGPSIRLNAQDAQTISLLVHELTTNAAKYGALSRLDGQLTIGWEIDAEGSLMFSWEENCPGFDPSAVLNSAPGFGSVLLNRVAERQMGGKLDRHAAPGVLRYRLSIPADSASRLGATMSTGEPKQKGYGGEKSVLIVEDEIIVAFDLEEMVGEMGHRVFGVASSLDGALAKISQGRPDIAILDLNLSGESSLPLAEKLARNGVPIIYSTGYEVVDGLPGMPESARIVQKPMAQEDLARTIADLTEHPN